MAHLCAFPTMNLMMILEDFFAHLGSDAVVTFCLSFKCQIYTHYAADDTFI